MIGNKIFKVTTIRKFFSIFCEFIKYNFIQKIPFALISYSFTISAHILPGILLFSLRYVSHNPYYCVALITTALGLNGASTVVSLANALDLAPNYAATISAMNNTFGALAGILAPMLITFYTKEQVISG